MTKFETVQVILSSALLFAVLSQLVVVLAQAVIYDQQRRIMKKMVDNVNIAERAYVGLRKFKLIGLDGQHNLAIEAIFKNGGRTPAWGFRTVADFVIAAAAPDEFKWEEMTTTLQRGFMSSGEESTVTFEPANVFSDDEIMAVQGQEKFIFLDGQIRYSTFDGHDRIFCFGFTYNVPKDKFAQRYQYERETVAWTRH